MDMPTPCPNCGEVVEFHDMVNHPDDYSNDMVCEDCRDRIEEDNNCGNNTDQFGNTIAWKADPDDGLIEFSVNGEELSEWSYEDDAEATFHDFMKIWNKAQASTQSHNLYDELVSLQALNNAHDGSTEVHDAIAAMIAKQPPQGESK